ncbi:MAG TPA: glycoside hydrolase family 15 protein [Gaiellaceae bacterium]|nr:glycoside hydrolase family 15 protein [Gaiellaceae bacterium]
MRSDGYAPIRDYAAVGDGRSVALVALDGSIDWLCFPDRDSGTVFGALLDPDGGGRFTLAPTIPYEVERRYLPETNILETTYRTPAGAVLVTDLMTLEGGALTPWVELARKVEGLSGTVPLRWSVEPRFGWGKAETSIELRKGVPVASSGSDAIAVSCWDAGELDVSGGAIGAELELRGGETALLALSGSHGSPVHLQPREGVELRIDGTAQAWRRWLRAGAYEGPWPEPVLRSVLALKLLIHTPTGAITAAPTSSLPERIGGPKNYDYRYAWARDSSFTLDAFMRLGYHEQAHASFTWLLDALRETHPSVSPIYKIRGAVLSDQRELDLPGYRASRPVREGNDAAEQLQLSGYGDLLTTTWLYVRDGNLLDSETGTRLAESVDLLAELWRNEDSGIWELDDREHYTQSKMGAWVAFDRALRLVEDGQLPDDRAAAWRAEAEAVRAWVEENCWSEERGSYTMYPGSAELDASCLLAARMEYGEVKGERSLRTIEAVRRELGRGPLLYRYGGMPEEEGAFVACSFWLVESLARAERFDEAAELMEELLPLANDVGLYSEQMDPETHEFLGNFPQGLSHLALVNAAALFKQSLEQARKAV